MRGQGACLIQQALMDMELHPLQRPAFFCSRRHHSLAQQCSQQQVVEAQRACVPPTGRQSHVAQACPEAAFICTGNTFCWLLAHTAVKGLRPASLSKVSHAAGDSTRWRSNTGWYRNMPRSLPSPAAGSTGEVPAACPEASFLLSEASPSHRYFLQ